MNSHLAKALEDYYQRQGVRIVFKNGMSLNKLALTMWEKLGFREIDASVVSRVLGGERLFTPSQLDVFCRLLKVSAPDREQLFYALHLDQCAVYGVELEETFFTKNDVIEFVEKIVDDTSDLLFKGKVQDILRVSSLIVDHLHNLLSHTNDPARRKKLIRLLGTSLHLKGRALGGIVLPKDTLKTLLPIYQELLLLARESNDRLLYAYAYTTYSSAHCISAGESFSKKHRNVYLRAIRSGKKAFAAYPDNEQDKFFALWTLISSYMFMQDKSSFYAISRDPEILRFISDPRPNNLVQGTHIYHMIARGEAYFGDTHASHTHQIPLKKYGNVMKGMRIQEVANIKTELEMLLSLKVHEEDYMLKRVKRGFEIAREEKSVRLIRNLEDIRQKIQ